MKILIENGVSAKMKRKRRGESGGKKYRSGKRRKPENSESVASKKGWRDQSENNGESGVWRWRRKCEEAKESENIEGNMAKWPAKKMAAKKIGVSASESGNAKGEVAMAYLA